MELERLLDVVSAGERSIVRLPRHAARKGAPMGPSDRCGKCGSRDVALIAYGLLNWTQELADALRNGEVVLGGCLVYGNDPDRACNDCRHKWRAARRRSKQG